MNGATQPPRSLRYRYLLGAMQQAEFAMTVRATCIEEDVRRLDELLPLWSRASGRMQELVRTDSDSPNGVTLEDPPAEVEERLHRIGQDPLFRSSFSVVPTRFAVVELDRLVAPQREVNLDYVETLEQQITATGIPDLINICLESRTEPPPIRSLQTAPNQMTFTSPSLDLRFLGGFPKTMTEEDIRVAHFGGQPARVLSLLVGFGAAPINVWTDGRRVVLNNGFHRVVALKKRGVSRIPVVVQQATNPDIEFPGQVLGLSKQYLLNNPRPVLVKDFFDDQLTVELRLKPRMKTLKVAWGEEAGVVPE